MTVALLFVLATFTAVWVNWLIDEATVWAEAWAVLQRQQTPAEFAQSGAACSICRTTWLTLPVLATAVHIGWWAPLTWAAINGAHLTLTRHANQPEPTRPASTRDLYT